MLATAVLSADGAQAPDDPSERSCSLSLVPVSAAGSRARQSRAGRGELTRGGLCCGHRRQGAVAGSGVQLRTKVTIARCNICCSPASSAASLAHSAEPTRSARGCEGARPGLARSARVIDHALPSLGEAGQPDLRLSHEGGYRVHGRCHGACLAGHGRSSASEGPDVASTDATVAAK